MELSEKVFRIDNVIQGVPLGPNQCRFDEKPLEKAMKDIIKEYTGDENTSMADPNDKGPDFCPVFVVATEGQNAGGPEKLFRSYGFYKDQCPIWQAARATSAAPSYFSPASVKIPDPGGWYIDGGLRRNNPAELALREARHYWRTVRRFCVVSVGTGVQKNIDFIQEWTTSIDADKDDAEGTEEQFSDSQPATNPPTTSILTSIRGGVVDTISRVPAIVGTTVSKLPFASTATRLSRVPGGLRTLKQFAEELVKLSTESEETHRKMWDLAHSHDDSLRFPYYRFNVLGGMDGVGLEEWKKITKIGALTRGYLSDPSTHALVERCSGYLLNPDSIERTSIL